MAVYQYMNMFCYMGNSVTLECSSWTQYLARYKWLAKMPAS